MDWEKLLSPKRLRDTTSPGFGDRSHFLRDYDRIVFSKPFRRLQKKTQVLTLPEHDFIHTRLTHSLETSCVGRSLGMMTGAKILEQYPNLQKIGIGAHDFAAIVSAAALAHVIGNPPFGHSGEKAISDFFKSADGISFLKLIPKSHWPDFQDFEGNAMGFRFLTRTLPGVSDVQYGINLTTATLGAFSKYPCEYEGRTKTDEHVSGKKYGFFQSEKETFIQVANRLGLEKKELEALAYYRHPLAFLVEAADDITYLLMDLEDGYNLNLVNTETVQEAFASVILDKSRLDTLIKIHDKREKVGYLRAIAINSLINQMTDVFMSNSDDIMNCHFDSSLANHIETAKELQDIRDICKKEVYTYRKVYEIEAAGYEVIGGLLYEFLNALNGASGKAKKISDLLPRHYNAQKIDSEAGAYEKVMHVVQYVAGMTDTYAIETYRVMRGISLPRY